MHKKEVMRMGRTSLFIMSCMAVALVSEPAQAVTRIHIDLSTQTMHVNSSSGSYTWPVSTARAGYVTPRGSFSPKSMQSIHYSRKYDNAPMPHSIFFSGGYAIHGSYATGSLGSPASHGCVRLSPGHAAQLYQMVQAEGATSRFRVARQEAVEVRALLGVTAEAMRRDRIFRATLLSKFLATELYY
jgi:hypothetical protein